MKLQPYIEKLNSSSEYKDFQKKYKNTFPVAGFFVLDFESGNNLHQIDYYVPSEKKIAAFTLDKHVTVQLLEMLSKKTPEKLDIKTKIDLDQLFGILDDEMKNRNITEQIKKIIAVVQNINGVKMWNLSCVLSGMGILNAHVDDESSSVLKMEKKNMLDLIQRMPASQLKAMQNGNGSVQPASGASLGSQQENLPEADIEGQIKKLDDIEVEIEKEKKELLKKSQKGSLPSSANAQGKTSATASKVKSKLAKSGSK